MTDKYICIRKCHYLDRLWEPGEQFVPPFDGAAPNRHFQINGKPVGDERIVQGPGDDPRSTAQMKKDLETMGVDADGMSRKDIWRKLVDLQGGVSTAPAHKDHQAADPNNSGARHNQERVPSNPSANKLFSDMGPDDIDGLTVKDIRAKLSTAPYSLELGSGVISKADLIKRGIAVEEQQKTSAQMG